MRVSQVTIHAIPFEHEEVSCDWKSFSTQLLDQWKRIDRTELENTGHKRRTIARLIERKYGVHALLVENYLRNLERTLPLFN